MVKENEKSYFPHSEGGFQDDKSTFDLALGSRFRTSKDLVVN